MIQIVVTHTTHQATYHPVPEGQSWRVDPASRCIVIGHGVPRQYVPLDGVLYFDLERHDPQPPPTDAG